MSPADSVGENWKSFVFPETRISLKFMTGPEAGGTPPEDDFVDENCANGACGCSEVGVETPSETEDSDLEDVLVPLRCMMEFYGSSLVTNWSVSVR